MLKIYFFLLMVVFNAHVWSGRPFEKAIDMSASELIHIMELIRPMEEKQKQDPKGFEYQKSYLKESTLDPEISKEVSVYVLANIMKEQWPERENHQEFRTFIQDISKEIRKDILEGKKEVFLCALGNSSETILNIFGSLSSHDDGTLSLSTHQLKLILFYCAESIESRLLNSCELLNLGKTDILHFKSYISVSKIIHCLPPLLSILKGLPELPKTHLGVPMIVSRTSHDSFPDNSFIRAAFRYMQENVATNPETSLDVVGIPPMFSLSGRGYSSAKKGWLW